MTPLEEWERCTPWLEEALAHTAGEYTLDDVLAEIEAGDAVFWPGKKSVIVTQFWTFPRSKAVWCWLAGGDMAEVAGEMRSHLEEWAKLQGCSRVLIAGRPGWARVLKDSGYEVMWTALGKDLS